MPILKRPCIANREMSKSNLQCCSCVPYMIIFYNDLLLIRKPFVCCYGNRDTTSEHQGLCTMHTIKSEVSHIISSHDATDYVRTIQNGLYMQLFILTHMLTHMSVLQQLLKVRLEVSNLTLQALHFLFCEEMSMCGSCSNSTSIFNLSVQSIQLA